MLARKVLFLAVSMLLITSVAVAQSSGNFTYGNTGGEVRCILNGQNGAITGGQICTQYTDCSSGTCIPVPDPDANCVGSLSAGIKTSSGAGNVFVIQPSAVIGLLTNVTVQKNATLSVGTSSAYAGVDFEVTVTDPKGKPAQTIPNFAVTYDARFIQISTNLFDVLGDLCTTEEGCFISFDMSTVSAHSFQWIVPQLQTGVYGIATKWTASLGNTGISKSLTCVGPVNLTVQQNKVFSFNTINQ